MNLTSCGSCGLVYDRGKIKFPEESYDEGGTLNDKSHEWRDGEFVAFVKCVCGGRILEKD